MGNCEGALYVRLLKELYECLQSVLIFYNQLVSYPGFLRFELKPYDPCVVNSKINVQRLTVVYHIDSLKVSHKYPKEVTKLLEWLKVIY